MEGIGDGMAAVVAGAGALQGTVTMGNIHIRPEILVEEILKGRMATMVRGLEAVVLGIEGENEVEVQWGGIEVRSEKVVQKGELR